MSTNNGKITAPVTILDVARTIGVASGDLGRLCESDNINKWSRYKPIALDVDKESLQPITIETIKNYVYGLEIPMMTLPQTLGMDSFPTGINWDYIKPKKGVNWHRLSDFNNYNHRSRAVVTKTMGHENSTMWQNVTFSFNQVTDNGLVPSNVNPKKWTSTEINTGNTLADMYVGVAFYKQREDDDTIGDFSGMVISENKVGTSASISVGFSTSNLIGTVYYLVFFCETKPANTSIFPTSFTVYPLENGFGSASYTRVWLDVDLWGVPNYVETEFYEISDSYRVSVEDLYLDFSPFGSTGASYLRLTPRNVATGLDTDAVKQRKIVFKDVVTDDAPDVLENNPIFNNIPTSGDFIFPLFDGIWDADNDSYVLTWKVTSGGVFSLYLWNTITDSKQGNDILNFSLDIGTGDNQHIIKDLTIANVIGTGAGAGVESVQVVVHLVSNGVESVRSAYLSGYKIAYSDSLQYQNLPLYTFGKTVEVTHGNSTDYRFMQVNVSINPA